MIPDWVPVIVMAPFVGSFLGTLVVRLPEGKPVVVGRSACPRCAHVLGPRDLMPLLSWAFARGRCRYCAAAIDVFYPAMEIAALVVAVWAATLVSGWVLWASCVLGWSLLTLAVIDARHMLLPDALTLPLTAIGLAVAGLLGGAAAWDSAIGAVAGFSAFAGLGRLYRWMRRRDGLGLGDAKLAAAAGAWVSWAGLPSVVALAALAGLAVAGAARLGGRPAAMADRIPFGPYLSAAIWLVWLHGPISIG